VLEGPHDVGGITDVGEQHRGRDEGPDRHRQAGSADPLQLHELGRFDAEHRPAHRAELVEPLTARAATEAHQVTGPAG